jgi:hypothetical protein
MAVTTAPIAGGTTGSLPDAAVAIDRISSADYQLTKATDPTVGSTSPIGVDANPLKVKARRAGTSDYDSGLVAVASPSPTAVTTATIYPEQGFIANPTSSAIDVTLTNTAGTTFLVVTIAAKSSIPFPCGGALVGLKAGGSASGLILNVLGGQ